MNDRFSLIRNAGAVNAKEMVAARGLWGVKEGTLKDKEKEKSEVERRKRTDANYSSYFKSIPIVDTELVEVVASADGVIVVAAVGIVAEVIGTVGLVVVVVAVVLLSPPMSVDGGMTICSARLAASSIM